MRFGLSYKIGKHGRLYIPLGSKSKKARSSSNNTGSDTKLGLLFWVGLILALGGIGGLTSGSIGGGILCLLIGLVLLFRKKIPEIIRAIKSKNETKTETTAITGAFDYEYTNVGLYRPEGAVGPMPKVGSAITFEFEPENPYDSDAVKAVYAENGQIWTVGYMNKGTLRDMVTDFLNRGQLVFAKVTRADDKLEIWMGMDK